MKKIAIGVIIGIAISLSVQAIAQIVPTQDQTRRWQRQYSLVGGDTISAVVTGSDPSNDSYTIPANKTAEITLYALITVN